MQSSSSPTFNVYIWFQLNALYIVKDCHIIPPAKLLADVQRNLLTGRDRQQIQAHRSSYVERPATKWGVRGKD